MHGKQKIKSKKYSISSSRGVLHSNSRESPAAYFTTEDEMEKPCRRKSFFNKKSSKSSILTVTNLLFDF